MLEAVAPEIPRGRWAEAQLHEQAYWQRAGDEIEAGMREQLDWYQWRATDLEQRLTSTAVGVPARAGRILEIGSGPIGIVNFLAGDERYAIDPLEHFYRTQPSLVALRRPGVTYVDGTGERLPFPDGSCSIVIIENVIDHTYAPRRILNEIHRVLDRDGRLYLTVNVHTKWGAALHTLLADLHIDKCHPFTFTSGRLRRLVAESGFKVLTEQIEDYAKARQADRASGKLKDRVKGFAGLSEFVHAVICSRLA